MGIKVLPFPSSFDELKNIEKLDVYLELDVINQKTLLGNCFEIWLLYSKLDFLKY